MKKQVFSKRELYRITGINHNSIVKWRKVYNQSGIEPLLKHGRVGGFKKSVVSKEEHDKIARKLSDPKNGIRGYTELLEWVNRELSKDMKYITLVKYTERHFGSKIKVARKKLYKTLDEVSEFIITATNALSTENIKSTCGFAYIFAGLN